MVRNMILTLSLGPFNTVTPLNGDEDGSIESSALQSSFSLKWLNVSFKEFTLSSCRSTILFVKSKKRREPKKWMVKIGLVTSC
jgi:hypothetical protein